MYELPDAEPVMSETVLRLLDSPCFRVMVMGWPTLSVGAFGADWKSIATYSSIASFPCQLDRRASCDRAGERSESNAAFSDRGKECGAESEGVLVLHFVYLDRQLT